MYRLRLLRAGWISLCLLISATASFPQDQPSAAPASDVNSSTQVIYTGKLLGYFRVPDRQSFYAVSRCLTSNSDKPSEEAFGFLKLRHENYANAILVGTGDNFAPQFEARVFNPVPSPSPGQYPTGNKELFFGDSGRWVSYEEINDPREHPLKKRLAKGLGTIPNDNVGCFLAAAQYAAIVPGKHDFYFGADRVRQFARFLASFPKSGKGYEPVQMLGANLVLKTVPIKDPAVLSGQQEKPWLKDNNWPKDYEALNLSDGKSVYPWFSYVKIKLAELKPDHQLAKELKGQLSSKSMSDQELAVFIRDAKAPANPADKEQFQADLDLLNKGIQLASQQALYICRSGKNENEIPERVDQECGNPLKNAGVHFVDNTLAYYYKLPALEPEKATEADNNATADKPQPKPKVKNGHFATLEAAQNYALCGIDSSSKESIQRYCRKFKTYTPFFYFPHHSPLEKPDGYTDPDPFVFIKERNVAIFGVVEPNLGEQVGVLNFGWKNFDEKLKTLVVAENPLEALAQQLDYFERWYEENIDKDKKFTGLKVLLAQMGPQRARVLSARFPGFHLVVSAADQDQSTSRMEFSTVWSQEKRAGAFLAVPLPAFDPNTQIAEARFGLVDAVDNGDGASWKLTSLPDQPEVPKNPEPQSNETRKKQESKSDEPQKPTAFRQLIDTALFQCAQKGADAAKLLELKPREALKWLTLCAIREKLGADVALIQKRDLFDQKSFAGEDDESRTQEILDRVIWKGDLLTLMYVPGKALKAALKRSKDYATDESAALLLVDDKGRQLETLGIFTHPVTKEDLINEAPIEDNKLYAVATTDYIAAGDTGYSMLATEALNPRTYPAGFPAELYTISSVVCRKVFNPEVADKNCLGAIDRAKYLDETKAKQIASLPPPSRFKRFWNASPFKWPTESKSDSSVSYVVEQKTQRRPIVMWSLRNLSVGFSSIFGSRTDKEISEKYTGVSPAVAISTQRTGARAFVLDSRLSRSTHQNEFFLATGIDYKRTSTGDGTAGTHPNIVQANNRLTWDAGVVHGLKGGRAPLRLGMIFTFHVETPFQHPFVLFNLSTKDAEGIKEQLKVNQGRNLLLLPRAGFRWLNGVNTFEFGVQGGGELDALRGYQFSTLGGPVECLPDPAKSFATCVSDGSDPAKGGTITKDSEGTAITANRWRAGFYAKSGFSIPIFSVAKYEPSYEGDLFFNFSGDTFTDTRYRHILKQNLKFTILPNLSVGPSWQVLWYRNKNAEHSYLIQHQVTMEVSFGFDVFNWREKQVQFKRKQ